MKPLTILLCAMLWLGLLSCDESLPLRIVPENTLAITDVIYTQGFYSSGPFMEFVFIITNLYEETFEEEVDIVGQARVWMVNKPAINVTLQIRTHHLAPPSKISGNVLTIDPNGRSLLKVYWYLTLDDGRYLLDLLDYSAGVAKEGLINSKPETFAMDAEIKLFNQIGYLKSERMIFSFVGYKKVEGP